MFVCRRPGPRRALRPTGGGVRTGGRAGRRVAQRGRRPTKPPPAMAARSSGRRPSAGRRLPARLAPGAKGRATSRCDAPAAYAARAARSSARAHGISPAWLLEQHTQQQQHLHLVVGDGRANISTCIRMGGGGIVRSLFQVSSWISDEASWLSHRSRWRFVQRSSGLYIMAMFGNSTAPMAHCFRAHPKTRVMPIVGVPPLWHVVWDIGRLWLHHRCATIVGLPSSLALVCRLQRLEATERGHMNTHGESEVVPSGMQARSPSQSTQPLADAW